MASITADAPAGETQSWRDLFSIDQTFIVSLFFLIAGVGVLLLSPNQIEIDPATIFTVPSSDDTVRDLLFAPEPLRDQVTTMLDFPDESDDFSFSLEILTIPYAVGVAIIYIITGVIGVLPLPERFDRVKTVLLVINGILIIPTVMVLAAAGKSTNMVTLLASSFRLATPIVIGAMAGIWCERSGVVNIAIEGMMLTGACFGFVMYTFVAESVPGQSGLYLGILIATLSGGLMALLHAWLSITFKTDQIISGTVINILALGLTSFTRREVLLEADASRETLQAFSLPLLSEIPILGEVLFTGKPVFFSMFVLIIITHVMLFFTRWGLRTRAVGENPHAADTLGISVIRNRYINVIVGGLIAGLAGAWFSLETSGTFDDNMTNGLGFIALAAVIFGKWRPLPAAVGGLLFGFSRALDTRFQILEVDVPVQFVQMTPYIVTMVILAGLVGRAIAPRAIGQPYEKE
jgi:general nucleoside transport system permease protein